MSPNPPWVARVLAERKERRKADKQPTIAQLQAIIFRYADHWPECKRTRCTCGFRAAWKLARIPRTVSGDWVEINKALKAMK